MFRHSLRRLIKVYSLCIGASLIICLPAVAGRPDSLWMRMHSLTGWQRAFSVKQTEDGGYIVAGTTESGSERQHYDLLAVRLDGKGDTLWTRSYGSNQYVWGGWAEPLADGGFLFTSNGSGGAFVVRTDAGGDSLWTRVYAWGSTWGLGSTSDGGFVITGGDDRLYILRLGGDGEIEWRRRYGRKWVGRSVQETSDGGFVVAGCWYDSERDEYDFLLMKVDARGDSVWSTVIDVNETDQLCSAVETSDGGFIATGYAGEFGPIGHLGASSWDRNDVYLIRTDSHGDTLWMRSYERWNGGEGYAVRELPDGGFLTGGHTGIFLGPIAAMARGAMDFYLVRTNANGDTLWTREYGEAGREGAYAMELTSDGGCILAGFTESYGARDSDFFVLKTESMLIERPVISRIVDVPDDQGRQVRITWQASTRDSPQEPSPISGYSIWRRFADWHSLDQRSAPDIRESHVEYPPGAWDFVLTVPARCEDVYSSVVPTLCDSTSQGICWSTFFVSAMTEEPSVYFDSEPDSGYSVDNLAPLPPGNLRFLSPTELAWDESQDMDFDHFSVYGSGMEVLDQSAEMIIHTSETHCDVTDEIFTYYHITATDFAGNEGEASSIPAAVGVSEYALFQSNPNPFGTKTAIRFHLAEPSHVNLSVFDVNGRLVNVLAHDTFPGGRHFVEWFGDDKNGGSVGSGVYLVRIECENFSDVMKTVRLR